MQSVLSSFRWVVVGCLSILMPALAGATIYDIGPGQKYPTIGSLTWTSLQAGDTVMIHPNTTDPQGAYHEKIFITTSGTASAPIRVIGVLDSNGNRPIIDGANATTVAVPRLNQDLVAYRQYYEILGLVIVDRSNYIDIENLQIQGAYSDATTPSSYFDSAGTKKDWGYATGLYVLCGQNVTLKNNILTNNADGFFVNSNYCASTQILFSGNYLYKNGGVGEYLYHNSYTESDGITIEYNHYGTLRTGADGTCGAKTRDTNATIRYNFFDSGDIAADHDACARLLDAVEIQGSDTPAATPLNVYGNVFFNIGMGNPIHFGAENDPTKAPNNKIMNFYDNTYYFKSSASDWRMGIFDESPGYTVDAINNIFSWNAPTTNPAFMWQDGTLTFTGPNWASSVIADNTDISTGKVSGRTNLITNAQNNPGFVNAATRDLHLAVGSQAIGAAGALSASLPAVLEEYANLSGNARLNVADLGGFEYAVTALSSPTISVQPKNQTTIDGTTATLTVVASGNPSPNEQWQISIDGGTSFANISGAVTASYTTPLVGMSDSGHQFRVMVNNTLGSVTSTVAVLTVTPAPVSFVSQPTNQSVVVGQTVVFSVSAAGTSPLSYQWTRSTDGGKTFSNITGAVSASYTTAVTTLSDNATQFKVTVTNSAGSAASNTATLTVTATPTAPSVISQPQNITVSSGQTAAFSVSASGTSPLSYQWSKSINAGSSFSNISGANSSSYTTPATALSDDETQLRVVVSNGVGNVTSNSATLTVTAAVPTNQAPTVNAGSNQTVTLPTSAYLYGIASDDGFPNPPGTLTTTWSKMSGPGTVVFGNTSALYTTANFSGAGMYVLRLTVGDSALFTTSDVTITVNGGGSGPSAQSSLSSGSVFDPDIQAGQVVCNHGSQNVVAASAIVYDRAGHKIRTLNSQTLTTNSCLLWDGKNDKGQVVADGLYVALVDADGKKLKTKLMPIRGYQPGKQSGGSGY